MYKNIQNFKNSLTELDNLGLYGIVTIGSIVAIFINMLFSIEIIQDRNISRYFLSLFVLGIVVSILFVSILYLSIRIFSNTTKNEINLVQTANTKITYYVVMHLLVFFYLVAISFISSKYFKYDVGELVLINGIESLSIFLYVVFTLAICSPLWIYEYNLNRKISKYDSKKLDSLE